MREVRAASQDRTATNLKPVTGTKRGDRYGADRSMCWFPSSLRGVRLGGRRGNLVAWQRVQTEIASLCQATPWAWSQ